jgi:hypothetical protein
MTPPELPSTRPRRVKLGWLLWLLIAWMCFFSLLGWLRLYGALSQWQWLLTLNLSVSPLYLAAGGAAWGVAGLLAGLGVWLRQRWAPAAVRLASAFFAASYWLDRLTVGAAGSLQPNWPFALIMTLMGLAFAWGIFSFPHTRLIFDQPQGSPHDAAAQKGAVHEQRPTARG